VRRNDPDLEDEEDIGTAFEGMYHFGCSQHRTIFRRGDNITISIAFNGFKLMNDESDE